MVNWNHGSGVACFFPFPGNNGVSSSTWRLMVRKKEIRNTPKDPHPFMLLLTCLTSVFPPKDIQVTLGRGNIGILSMSVKSLTHWLTKVFSGSDSLQNLSLRKKSVREYLCRSRYTSFFSSQPRDALRGPNLWHSGAPQANGLITWRCTNNYSSYLRRGGKGTRFEFWRATLCSAYMGTSSILGISVAEGHIHNSTAGWGQDQGLGPSWSNWSRKLPDLRALTRSAVPVLHFLGTRAGSSSK